MSGPFFSVMASILWQSSSDVANRFNGYLILGYLAMWIVGFAYIISLASRQRNIQQDIQLLEQILQDDELPAD